MVNLKKIATAVSLTALIVGAAGSVYTNYTQAEEYRTSKQFSDTQIIYAALAGAGIVGSLILLDNTKSKRRRS